MKIEISNFSCYDKGVTSGTENVSSIIDKMIRLSAKLTESYASDIVYDIEDLNDAVKEKKPLDHLLFFREYGVTTRKVEGFDADAYDSILFNFTPIQVWRLTYNPETTETKLIRVNVRKELF